MWACLAAWLGFLAVLSALLAPVSMLAEQVRTGKLGGVCSVGAVSSSGSYGAGAGDNAQPGSHCEFCGTPGGLAPPPVVVAIAHYAGDQVAIADVPSARAARLPGLPFSRGPPLL